ncbi:hypothetical protein [Bacillus salipaludis]|uniref:hypothetical protein n=1 Tax=Bacillus salipaludis TaxID=2547811 RepID=UPI002E1FF973|nr:hypothetical protein [Bacillus salipaludis]
MLIFALNVITGLNPNAVILIVHTVLIALKNLYHTNNVLSLTGARVADHAVILAAFLIALMGQVT